MYGFAVAHSNPQVHESTGLLQLSNAGEKRKSSFAIYVPKDHTPFTVPTAPEPCEHGLSRSANSATIEIASPRPRLNRWPSSTRRTHTLLNIVLA